MFEKEKSMRRITVGEKNPDKTNKTILLVGETGAGKSTLINTLFNYSMGVKWEEKVWFQMVEQEKSLTESQTSDVIMYEIFDFEDETLPYSLTIIDTPGYGNTKGVENDDIISHQLLDVFKSEDGVHEVHAVGLVLKATDNRMNYRPIYVLDSVMSLFGKDLEKNIVALITHSDGGKPKNPLKVIEEAKIKCARNENNELVYFLFDNKQTEERTEEDEYLQHAGKLTMTSIKEFTDFLGKMEPQKLLMSSEVLNNRIKLTACIKNLQEKIKLTKMKQTEIKQIQEALRKHEEEMTRNETFTVEVDEPYKHKENISGGMWGLGFYSGALCCTVCEETCHYPGCTMAWYPGHCEVITKGHCIVCTNKCPVSAHVKGKWKYVTKTRRVMKTETSMKEKYDENKAEGQKKLSSLLENLKKEMNKLAAEKSQFLDESYQHVVRLTEIALKADSASTIVHLDLLIEKMKERGDTEKVQKLEEMRRKEDEGTRAVQNYRWGKYTKAESGSKDQLKEQNSSDSPTGEAFNEGAKDQLEEQYSSDTPTGKTFKEGAKDRLEEHNSSDTPTGETFNEGAKDQLEEQYSSKTHVGETFNEDAKDQLEEHSSSDTPVGKTFNEGAKDQLEEHNSSDTPVGKTFKEGAKDQLEEHNSSDTPAGKTFKEGAKDQLEEHNSSDTPAGKTFNEGAKDQLEEHNSSDTPVGKTFNEGAKDQLEEQYSSDTPAGKTFDKGAKDQLEEKNSSDTPAGKTFNEGAKDQLEEHSSSDTPAGETFNEGAKDQLEEQYSSDTPAGKTFDKGAKDQLQEHNSSDTPAGKTFDKGAKDKLK